MNPLDALKEEIPHLKASFDSAFLVGEGGIGLTQYVFWMFICLALTLIVVLVAAHKLKPVPSNKFVNMVEYGYDLVRGGVAKDAIGHGYKRHVPFLASIFFFILISNFVGLIPGCKTPTGSISVTWALAIVSFVYFNYWGVKAHGGLGYLKSFCPSGLPIVLVPIVWFLELVSACLRALTLAVRLYANMFAGHMVLGIFALLTSLFISYAINNTDLMYALPAVGWVLFLVAMYALEVLVAFLQAYVFTILSAVYISLATSEH
ncbi:MAG: F0F1 ATP synthase subunit A [Coriobacteriaceae bacterium]|nr:F0F1 ATP synthase subunit A [Coriobacteriaceae bacterium]